MLPGCDKNWTQNKTRFVINTFVFRKPGAADVQNLIVPFQQPYHNLVNALRYILLLKIYMKIWPLQFYWQSLTLEHNLFLTVHWK